MKTYHPSIPISFTVLLLILQSGQQCAASESAQDSLTPYRYVLQYDEPAVDDLQKDYKGSKSPQYMQQALPMGNGRLGMMFSGGIDEEHLLINDITLWMNTKRGLDEVSQSGVRKGAFQHLENVREAYRRGKYGTGKDSMEGLSTTYLSSKEPLGNYAPFTDVFISTDHNPALARDYRRMLDTRTGLGSVSYRIGKARFTREYFCSYPHDMAVVRYTSEGSKLNLTIRTSTKHQTTHLKAEDGRIILTGEVEMVRDNIQFMQVIQVDAGDGKVTPEPDGSYKITGATDVRIYLTGYSDYQPVYPTFKGRDFGADCENTMQVAAQTGYDVIKESHVADVSGLIRQCSLELDFEPSGLTTDQLVARGGSLELENLYFNYARYLQLSCSRDAPVPSNLQGLWNPSLKPAWNCDYHNDINLAMNYWMVETANLPGSFSPYWEWMKVQAQSGSHTAREGYGINQGWSMGLNGNVYGFTAPNVHGRRMQQSGAWLSQNLYEHYAFSQDKDYLERIYPVIKGAAEFYVAFLAPWKDGTLVVYPTWSPENCYLKSQAGKLNKQAYGASWDQQIVLNLFTDCIEASTILDRDESFRKTLQQSIPRLCPQKIGQYGQVQEWPEDWDDPKDTHRHISHLIALHPGRDFSPLTTKALADAAHVTMAHRGDESTGWSTAWKTCFWARLHNGDKAHQFYRFLTAKRAYPNLFDYHPPFQIDGNFGGAAGVCEMLLQSHLRSIHANVTEIGDAAYRAYQRDPDTSNHFLPVVPDEKLARAPYILHLLPALPSAWATGQVSGLRARGGFEVELAWEKCCLKTATVLAEKGSSFRLYVNDTLSDTITLEKGQRYCWPADLSQ